MEMHIYWLSELQDMTDFTLKPLWTPDNRKRIYTTFIYP